MSDSSILYNNLIKAAIKEKNKLSSDRLNEIIKLYSDVAYELLKKASIAKGGFTKAWLKDYEKYIRFKILELNSELSKVAEEAIKSNAEIAASVQGNFLSYINNKYILDISRNMIEFAYSTNSEVIGQIIQGSFYKDGRSLSERIWSYGNQYGKDIKYVLTKGMAEQKSYLEIIKDLEKYLDPNAKKDFNFCKVYPGLKNRKVDYNAQRLLRTSMTHMFRLQSDKKAIDNPFITKGKWNLSSEHYSRQVAHFGPDICDDYAGKLFDKDKIPMQHPQCLCYITYEMDKSLDDIGRELGQWINGKEVNYLDEWLKGA